METTADKTQCPSGHSINTNKLKGDEEVFSSFLGKLSYTFHYLSLHLMRLHENFICIRLLDALCGWYVHNGPIFRWADSEVASEINFNFSPCSQAGNCLIYCEDEEFRDKSCILLATDQKSSRIGSQEFSGPTVSWSRSYPLV